MMPLLRRLLGYPMDLKVDDEKCETDFQYLEEEKAKIRARADALERQRELRTRRREDDNDLRTRRKEDEDV